MKDIIALGLMGIGLLILIWAGWKLTQQKSFVDESVTATGQVVAYEYTDSSRVQRSQDTSVGFAGRVDVSQASPVIRFTTQDGDEIEFVSSSTASVGSGETLEVLYRRGSPKDAVINDFFSLWGWIYLLGGFGAIGVLIGVMLKFLFK
jgi:Protein of unknown function (DUF3592)